MTRYEHCEWNVPKKAAISPVTSLTGLASYMMRSEGKNMININEEDFQKKVERLININREDFQKKAKRLREKLDGIRSEGKNMININEEDFKKEAKRLREKLDGVLEDFITEIVKEIDTIERKLTEPPRKR